MSFSLKMVFLFCFIPAVARAESFPAFKISVPTAWLQGHAGLQISVEEYRSGQNPAIWNAPIQLRDSSEGAERGRSVFTYPGQGVFASGNIIHISLLNSGGSGTSRLPYSTNSDGSFIIYGNTAQQRMHADGYSVPTEPSYSKSSYQGMTDPEADLTRQSDMPLPGE